MGKRGNKPGPPQGRRPERKNGASRSPPPGGRSSAAQWIASVAEDWRTLQHAPAEARADPEVVCEAMRNSDGEALLFASDELRGDREYVLGASQEIGPGVLQHASAELKADRAFMMEVVDYCPPGEVLHFMPDELREELLSDRDFVLQAVQDAGAEMLDSVPETLRGQRDFILAVADVCPPGEALSYATDALRAELYADRAFMLQAVRAVGAEVLEDASEALRGDRDFLREAAACCGDGDVLQYASEAVRAEFGVMPRAPAQGGAAQANIYLSAEAGEAPADGWGQALSSAARATPEWDDPEEWGAAESWSGEGVSAAAAPDATGLVSVPKASMASPPPAAHEFAANPQDCPPAVVASPGVPAPPAAPVVPPQPRPPTLHEQGARVLQAVREMGPPALGYASGELRADKDFIVAAASCCSTQEVLRYASDKVRAELSNDRAFLLKFLREVGASALEYASLELRGDREFMLSTAVVCPPREALRYSTEGLRAELCGDKAFMLKAVWQVGTPALEHASVELRGDRDFMFNASFYVLTKDVLAHASDAVRAQLAADRNFMKKALRETGSEALRAAGPELHADREFMLAAALCCPPREVQHLASEEVRAELSGDKEFMKKAVWESGAAVLALCSPELRGDREFVMIAASFSPVEALQHASEQVKAELASDRSYMLKAVKEVGAKALEHAAEELRADLGFMLSVSGVCSPSEALPYATEGLRAMLEDDDEI